MSQSTGSYSAALAKPQGFDYQVVSLEIRGQVKQYTEEIRGLMRRAAQDIVAIGQALIRVKEALPHGQFGAWLQAEFEWSDQTALNFMSVARRFGEIPEGLEFAPKALYLLSSASVPESARQEAKSLATEGEPITPKLAQQIIEVHTLAPEDRPHEEVNEEPEIPNGLDFAPWSEDLDIPNGLDFGMVSPAPEIPDELETSVDPELSTAPPPEEDPAPDQVPLPPSRTEQVRRIMTSSKTDEHYTPAWLWQTALEVFGVERFDLDPCSNSHESPNVPAHRVYTSTDDGLVQDWIADTLWMNHPYSRSSDWINKLCSEYERGNVKQAIALIKVDTSTQWFRRLREYPICFLLKRITFLNSLATPAPATFASAVVYLGPNLGRFVEKFEPHGDIWIWLQKGVA